MATTRLMPLHTGKGRDVGTAISDIIDYAENPEKTDYGRLITGYACDSRTADAEFLFSKRQYAALTGRARGADDVIAYHLRQSFVPGEITPEEANRIGCEFARRFTKGDHAFIVCTHIDKKHIHNHIIWNSMSLDCTRKFRNFWGSTRAVRRLNDTLCMESGLSIVENPKRHGKSYNKWLGDRAKPSHRELLRAAIDTALAQKPADFDALLKLLQKAGYEVKPAKIRSGSSGWTPSEAVTGNRSCGPFSPAKRRTGRARKSLRQRRESRSVCWWIFRPSSAPEKASDMNAGRRFSISSRWRRQSIISLSMVF